MRVTGLALTVAMLAAAPVTSAEVTAPVSAAAVLQPVVAVPEKMICKSSIETGSLIKRHKACFTAKQWRYVDDQHEREARKLVEDGTGKPNGN